ncbi:MAG TPA: alanyl-tRNA editing protein [Alphaproteobacteria bacterium]|nr:alanyl-tRNA editing protein [Alphaproteobacteria bacterium]
MPAQLLFRDDAYLQTCTAKVMAAGPEGVRLDRTVFYATAGGQPGDTGVMRWNGGEAKIADTRKFRAEGQPDDFSHILAEDSTLPAPGDEVEIALDWDRRYAHMRMHTCLHLLSALLREAAVTGGQVGADKSRLDFNIPENPPDKDHIAAELNRLIGENHAVAEQWITDEELAAQPDLVRTMSVKPPTGMGRVRLLRVGDGVDLQPCGGTHVKATGEIGPVEVLKIESKGKQNRRIVVALKN